MPTERPAPEHSPVPERPYNTELCRSCNVRIIWATSNANKKDIPIDAEPVDGVKGSIRLTPAQPTEKPIAFVVPPAHRSRFHKLYLPHFATCPDADRWRHHRGAAHKARSS